MEGGKKGIEIGRDMEGVMEKRERWRDEGREGWRERGKDGTREGKEGRREDILNREGGHTNQGARPTDSCRHGQGHNAIV